MDEATTVGTLDSDCDVLKISEGSATILFPNSNEVFYNPVQEFNRDLRYIIFCCYNFIISLNLWATFNNWPKALYYQIHSMLFSVLFYIAMHSLVSKRARHLGLTFNISFISFVAYRHVRLYTII